MSHRIKACPFCGRMARLIDAPEASNEGAVVVECHSCHASGPVVFGVKDDPRPLAIYAWNRRVEPEKPAEEGTK